tara:strand:- start:822 stop:989 length:168 start_codon:yes stop_codon:yes gene_type:complete
MFIARPKTIKKAIERSSTRKINGVLEPEWAIIQILKSVLHEKEPAWEVIARYRRP